MQRSALRAIVLSFAATSTAACGATAVPPREMSRPRPVALLDHGRHSSLLLGTADGAMVRYAYGDWRWYALGETGVGEGSVALLVPSKAALGRRRHHGPLGPEAVAREIAVAVEVAYHFEVETAAAEALLARLDTLFSGAIGDKVFNRSYDLEFVPHPLPYSLAHNSNSVVADWLRELGVEVRGTALFADWTFPKEVLTVEAVPK